MARQAQSSVRALGRLALALAAVLLPGCPEPAVPPGPRVWSVAHEEPTAALLTVCAAGAELLAAGADDGTGPRLLRRVGAGFVRVDVPARGTLWWIAQDGPGFLLVGEAGLVLSLAAADGVPAVVTTPADRTLFGAWAAPDGTAWAVGGDIAATTGRGRMFVRRAGAWQSEDRIDPALLDPLLFKVWGRAADDVWAVGERGAVLHFDGARWTAVTSGTNTRLLTVHGAADALYAVGGTGSAVLLEWGGSSFADVAPDFVAALNGVRALGSGGAIAVGNSGTILEREAGAWTELRDLPTTLDLHAVTVDDRGEAWAVGGALFSPTLDHGVVVHGVR